MKNPEGNHFITRDNGFSKPVVDLIQQRYSCRTYQRIPLEPGFRIRLSEYVRSTTTGPLGHQARFELVTGSEQDAHKLRSLGTYGFISGAQAYLVGAMPRSSFSPEDYGYLLEQIILFATGFGLGTCWLGGTFTKSSFARQINARAEELVPAVSPVGYPAKKPRRIETWLKGRKGTQRRYPSSQLFFEGEFNQPLPVDGIDGYQTVLDMVRLAPSASNRQPWRLVRKANRWHFYLQRTPGYRTNPLTRWTTVADLQRIDMGIAMCHFELSARELGLRGRWKHQDPRYEVPDPYTEYSISWIMEN